VLILASASLSKMSSFVIHSSKKNTVISVLLLLLCSLVTAQDQQQQQQAPYYATFYSTRELRDAVDLYLANYASVSASIAADTAVERAENMSNNTASNTSTTTYTPPTALDTLLQTYGPIEQWKTERIRDFSNLFNVKRNSQAATINLDLSLWDTSEADSMIDMFLQCENINFDVSQWDVSKVVRFNGMFDGATSFQGQGLEQWNVVGGRYFQNMFRNTPSLSADLSSWNVKNAQNLNGMFYGSTNFAGNLCPWAYRQLYPGVTTVDMLVGTNCLNTTDPDIAVRANAPISFCNNDCSVEYQQHYNNNQDRRPNVLLIMTDQQRYDTIRYVQDRLTRYDNALKINTPNLDVLLQSGAYFENAYTQW
jgi:Mycoplasma protein of unknown function, DUF285